ncbi:BTAD domain-containing putative transcriptional regulator [Kribbella sp. NPDC050124]|uniref:AfsR/SARP family transcriptional regulator n=1 Tax=Kribbella sp. NPDC050124 TaxID=3364114 RepID=UPI0037AF07A7
MRSTISTYSAAFSVRTQPRHIRGRERLLAARLDLGEAALVVAELEGMVAEEPLREERWRLLALGLYRAHRQADALAALRRARETLADELGVDPGPALRELEAQVLAQSPELVPAKQPGSRTTAPQSPRGGAHPPPRTCQRLVQGVEVNSFGSRWWRWRIVRSAAR